MDVVDFLAKQVDLWNENSKCDFCWTFGAPLTESAVELQEQREDSKCCVQVLLLQDKVTPFNTQNTYNQQTGLLERIVCNRSFQLLFLIPDAFSRNNFNEISGHDTSSSRWANILQRLESCLSCEINLDFCEILGRDYWVTQWSAKQEINYSSKNYSGYRITVTIQKIV